MRTLLYTLCLLVLPVNCFAVTAKWTKHENWRNIKDNMPERAVKRLLGTPKFTTYTTVYEYHLKRAVGTNLGKTRQDFIGKIYYYSSKEPFVNKKNQIVFNYDGYVSFHKTSNKSKLFVVNKIKEPVFSNVIDAQKERPKKLKPKRKLEKWQVEKAWKRLKRGMSDKAVLKLLGEPTNKTEERGTYKYYWLIRLMRW